MKIIFSRRQAGSMPFSCLERGFSPQDRAASCHCVGVTMETGRNHGKAWPLGHSSWGHMEGLGEAPGPLPTFWELGVSFGQAVLLVCAGLTESQAHTSEILQVLLYRKLSHFFSAVCWRSSIIPLKSLSAGGATTVIWASFGSVKRVEVFSCLPAPALPSVIPLLLLGKCL